MTQDRPSPAHGALIDAHREQPSAETRIALMAAMTVEAERAQELAQADLVDASQQALRGALTLGAVAFPDGDPRIGPVHQQLAESLEGQGNVAAAIKHYREALAHEGDPPVATTAGRVRARLAVLLHRAGELADAEPLYRDALQFLESDLGPRHPGVAVVTNSLATLAWQTGRPTEAVRHARQALDVLTEVYAPRPNHPEHEALVVQQLDLAHLLERTGRAGEAVDLYRQALGHRARKLGEDHPDLGVVWLGLAHALNRADRPAEAIEAYQQALSRLAVQRLPTDPAMIGARRGLAQVLCRGHRIDEAITLLETDLEGLAFRLGADDEAVLEATDFLTDLLEDSGRYEQAEAWIRGAHGPPRLRDALARGRLLYQMGRLTEAEAVFRAARHAFPDASDVLTGLATVALGLGRTSEAEQFAREALDRAATSASDRPAPTAGALNNLARVLREAGRLDEAETLYRRALGLYVRALGAGHPNVGLVTNNLAMTLAAAGRYDEAETLSGHALALAEHAFGPDHPMTLARRSNRAVVLRHLGRLEEAEAQLRETEARLVTTRPADHPDLGTVANNLGEVLAASGKTAEAEQCFVRGIQRLGQAFGTDHPLVGDTWLNLARLRVTRRRLDEAHVALERALDVEEIDLWYNLPYGTPSDRRIRMAQVASSTADAITLHLRWRSTSEAAARLALTTLLRRKGRAVEVERDTLAEAREGGAAAQRVLTAVRDLRANLARLTSRAPTEADAFAMWRQSHRDVQMRLAEHERALSTHLPDRSETPQVDVTAVSKALGPRRGLIEFVVYVPHDFDRGTAEAPRIGVYWLDGSGTIAARDLGLRRSVDGAVQALRQAIVERRDPTARARTLYRMLFEPFAARLREIDEVVVAPAGTIGLVPLDLVLEAGGITVARRLVTTGRDLLRPPSSEPGGPAVVVYDVDYGSGGRWPSLPGTATEGRAILARLPGARGLNGRAATETAVRACSAPAVLHVASHGYTDPPAPTVEPSTRFDHDGRLHPRPAPPSLALRSGVVLAGANHPPRGDDDGRLTAAEVASLNLRGTQLVVLSACETGLGTPEQGEGIAGLRRALVVAGSRAQLLSLWSVDDQGTAVLMTALYDGLARGLPVGRALDEAKARVRRDPRGKDPFVWAAFTLSGDRDARIVDP